MKTFVVAALAGLAAAESGLSDYMTQSLFKAFKLGAEHVTTENPKKPVSRAFGYDSNGQWLNTDENFGIDLGLNVDIGMTYSAPIYNRD